MRALTSNQKPFTMAPHFRRLRAALRMPLLSIGVPVEPVQFVTWETRRDQPRWAKHKREQVTVQLNRRWSSVELARDEDTVMLDLIVSRATHATDQANGCGVSTLLLTVDELLRDLEFEPEEAGRVIASLRRLTNTQITVRRSSGRKYAPRFNLLDITRSGEAADGCFQVVLSEWLEDEIMAKEVVVAPLASSRLTGIRSRLYGWLLSWVGREHGDGRIIWQSEVLDRLGPLPGDPGRPWDEVVGVVEANDLPDCTLELTTNQGSPAILIRPRPQGAPRAADEPLRFSLNEICLELEGDALTEPKEQRPPREIGL